MNEVSSVLPALGQAATVTAYDNFASSREDREEFPIASDPVESHAEIGVENAQSCYYSIARDLSVQAPANQGFGEDGEGRKDAAPYSILGYSGSATSQDDPTCTTPDDEDDDRSVGVRRKGARSTHLPKAEWEKGQAAWKHARLIMRMLNAFLTINDPEIRDAAPSDRPSLWRKHHQRLRVFFQNNREPLTWLWCRSSMDKHGSGEHLHCLIHVPKRLVSKFEALVSKHWPEPLGKLQWVRRDGFYPVAGGKMTSISNYVLQGLAYPVAASLGVKWYYSGAIVGKRCGWSDDISPAAVAAHRSR